MNSIKELLEKKEGLILLLFKLLYIIAGPPSGSHASAPPTGNPFGFPKSVFILLFFV